MSRKPCKYGYVKNGMHFLVKLEVVESDGLPCFTPSIEVLNPLKYTDVTTAYTDVAEALESLARSIRTRGSGRIDASPVDDLEAWDREP